MPPEDLAPILTELIAREPIFHRPEHGTTRADFESMTSPAFWEIGASGQIYTRDTVLDLLELRYATSHEEDLQASNFRCQPLAPSLYLLTYNLVQNQARHTRRSTIWQLTPQGWQIVFHQGTIIEQP